MPSFKDSEGIWWSTPDVFEQYTREYNQEDPAYEGPGEDRIADHDSVCGCGWSGEEKEL